MHWLSLKVVFNERVTLIIIIFKRALNKVTPVIHHQSRSKNRKRKIHSKPK